MTRLIGDTLVFWKYVVLKWRWVHVQRLLHCNLSQTSARHTARSRSNERVRYILSVQCKIPNLLHIEDQNGEDLSRPSSGRGQKDRDRSMRPTWSQPQATDGDLHAAQCCFIQYNCAIRAYDIAPTLLPLFALDLRVQLVQSALKRPQQDEIRSRSRLECLVIGDENLRSGQIHTVIHILPRGCPGGEIEHHKVTGVPGSSLVCPDQWVVNVQAFECSIVLNASR